MNLKTHIKTVLAALVTTSSLAWSYQDTPRSDVLVADFEGDTYGNWKVEGEAFGPGPAKGTLPGQMHVSGYKGKRLVNTFFNRDRTVGTLTSPPIKVERNYLSFLVGGGGHRGKTCMNLLLDGKTVRSVTGTNNQPGGSETLQPGVWDVKKFNGKTVTLQIVDAETGGWGHVNVDHIVQTDTKPKIPNFGNNEKEFTVKNKYLVIPIQDSGGKGGQIQLFVDDEEVRRYGLSIAPSAEATNWYAYFIIESYKGK